VARGKVILEGARFHLTIERLCRELIETYGDFHETCLVGIQQNGIPLTERLANRLSELLPKAHFHIGKLDVTFYRDDFRQRNKSLAGNETVMNFLVENRNVVLIDDVLYTGRTIHAAMSALQDFGRPAKVELVALIDRRFNRHLPIRANYVGMVVDSLDEAYVQVEWKETDGSDRIRLFSKMHD
jgi:pyrimidine operon attenuation protein/uracil phosphoribosyltransferase